MTAGANYRSESRAIRMAARDYLARLRAARLGVAVEPPAPAAPVAKAPGAEVAMLQASPAAGELARDARDAACQDPGCADGIGPAGSAATPEVGVLVEAPVEMSGGQDEAGCVPAADIPPDPEPDRSPLLDLPGAGPGLVWLLQTAGVRSLADLAACGEADLRARLGPVGELVNLGGWIAHAGTRASRESADGPPAGSDPFIPH